VRLNLVGLRRHIASCSDGWILIFYSRFQPLWKVNPNNINRRMLFCGVK
jgi:hypothetical protein